MSSLRRSGVRVSMLAVAAVLAVAGAGLSAVPAAGQPQPDTTAAQVSPAVEPAAPAASASRAAAAAPAPASADLRGDIVSRRGVPVRNVTVSSNGAAVTATVYWNQQMIARKGNRDRFNVRLAAFGAGGAGNPIVLKNRSKKKRPPAVQKINIKLNKKQAKKLRASGDVVLAVSQQYGLKGTHHNRYFRQYVTVTKIKAGSKTRVSAGRDCSTIEIKPGANLSGCDLSRANISICDLADVNLSGANLSGAILNKCNLSGAQLAGADLAGVRATGITGTPASLPDGWALVNGVLTTTGPRPPPATFTVTYDGNTSTGGSVPVDGSSPYVTGSTVTVAGNTGNLVKTGNTFNNWNTAANGSGTSYAPAATFTISADTVLYAQWTPVTFTVTYDGNTSTGGSVPVDGSSPYVTGSTVTVAGNTGSLVKTGNTFAGWNTAADGSGTAYAPAATFTISADTVLYAQWTPVTFTVTYDGNTSTGGSVPVDGSSPYVTGSTVTVAGNTGNLVKTGNTFAGWNTAADGSGTAYAPAATFTISADTVLYAQWTPVTFTVTYDGNTSTGGSVPVDGSSPYATGSTVTVAGNTGNLVKTGNTFNNWNTAANGSGTSYAPAATFTISADTVLYAQWTVDTFTVTYDGNTSTGGSVPVDGSSPYVTGSTVTVAGNTGSLVKTGNTFAGWNTAADGSGTAYAPAATFTISADTVLYAQWTPVTFTVTYDGNTSTGGSVPVDGSSPYVTGSTVTVAGNTGNLVKTGNTFAGWNTAADGSGTAYAPAATFTISADTVLYAQWTPVTFTVTYDGNTSTGGSVPVDGSSPYATGSTVTVAGNTGNLVKTGNTFNNWNTAANGSGTSYAPAATFTISADTVLYAQWTAAASCATGGGAAGTCVVGDTGPGGGEVFYVNESNPDGSRYMEAVVAGMSPAWDDTNGGNYYQWCAGTGQTNNVVTGTAIGSGKTNTDNMVTACTSGAANSVRAYTGGGLPAGSWSLPSLDELNALDVSGVGGLGAFRNYWSSSQGGASVAWYQRVGFGGGSDWQFPRSKSNSYLVRPVRAF